MHRLRSVRPGLSGTAIFALEDLPEKWNSFTPINADWYAKKGK